MAKVRITFAIFLITKLLFSVIPAKVEIWVRLKSGWDPTSKTERDGASRGRQDFLAEKYL
jgi:hypothetical protein